MLWFFERRNERVVCEIRPALDPGQFELIWTASDGGVHAEQSSNPAYLEQKLLELERRLGRDGWVRIESAVPVHSLRPRR